MHWLLVRPAIGWGAFLLIHALGIPAVYKMGKACAEKKNSRQEIASFASRTENEAFTEH